MVVKEIETLLLGSAGLRVSVFRTTGYKRCGKSRITTGLKVWYKKVIAGRSGKCAWDEENGGEEPWSG